MSNTLYYGDNRHVLREHVTNDSVDLIYLDPPFNSNAKICMIKPEHPANQDAALRFMAAGSDGRGYACRP